MTDPTRRELLLGTALGGTSLALSPTLALPTWGAGQPVLQGNPLTADEPFAYCLNTSTIRGKGLDLLKKAEIASKAGYQAIEPWEREIKQYQATGGTLGDLAKRLQDLNLKPVSVIGFARWIVDDPTERQKGLDQAKRLMEMAHHIGAQLMAAPPAGATNKPGLDLFQAADRYGALLELGRQVGVIPQLEVWGFSKNLARLGEAALVAMESGQSDACLLPDIYHIYKGGSDFAGLHLLAGQSIHLFHINDYPAQPTRDAISDRHRVYPGDGVAPVAEILRTLRKTGFQGTLSLELFNPTYWQQDPLEVARTGLEKMRSVVKSSKIST